MTKVAVLSYSGTIGKTTICTNMLASRMNAPIFAVETINETAAGQGLEVQKISGERYRELFKKILLLDDAIIDVGASNVEAFLEGMVRFEDSHVEFDYFIVPVTSGTKEQKETLSTINTLNSLGIKPEKIRIIFNRVKKDVQEEFTAVINYANKEKTCIANPEAAIYENEIFDMLAVKKINLNDVVIDDKDYKAKAREETDTKLKTYYSDLHVMKALSKNVNRNLDAVYEAVFS